MAPAAPPAGAAPDWPADAVEVGRIVDAWGIKGWVKVVPFASDPQALFSSRRWFVLPPEEGGLARPVVSSSYPPLLKVMQAREHGGAVVAQVQDVADRSGAEALRGARLFVGRASFPTAGDGEYYWVDLIGLQVINRQGESLGEVLGLLDTGAHSVLRVLRPGDKEERLIPFVGAYIDDVSLQDKLIRVDWGLDY